MLKRQPRLVVFLILQLLISSCVPSSMVKTGKSPYSHGLPEKKALSLSDYVRTVYKVSQENTEEVELLRRKLLDSNPELALAAARIEANANDMESRKILAAAYLDQGLLSSAYQLYHEIRIAAGDRTEFEVELGLARIWDKWADYTLAIQHAGTAASINPRSAAAYEVLGKIRLHRNEPGEAVRALTLALELAPDTPAVLANLGYAYMLAGNLTDARAAIEKALALDGSLAEARNNLGIILAKTGDTSGALAQMQQVGGTSVALNNLGALLLVQQRPAEAMQAFQEALHLDPGYTRAAENLSAARALVPPPTIVNLPRYEASSAGSKRTEDVSFSQKIRDSATPGPNIEAARRLAAVHLDPGVFQGRIDPDDLKALLPSSYPEALPAPLPPLQPRTEVPAFISELLKTPTVVHVDSVVRTSPLPMLKSAEPVLTAPIEPPTEVPRFALELQRAGHQQNVGSSMRAVPPTVFGTSEPALTAPLAPPTEIPQFALELQRTDRLHNPGPVQVHTATARLLMPAERPIPAPVGPPTEVPRFALELQQSGRPQNPVLNHGSGSRVLAIAEPAVAAPIAPPAEVPRFALELQKTGRVENLGSVSQRALPTGPLDPKEPLSVEPQQPVLPAAFVPAPATAEQTVERDVSIRTPRVAAQRKTVRQTHSSAVTSSTTNTPKPPTAGQAPAKVAVQPAENAKWLAWFGPLFNVSASPILIAIALALAIFGAGLLSRRLARNSRQPYPILARRLAPQPIRTNKPIRDVRAG